MVQVSRRSTLAAASGALACAATPGLAAVTRFTNPGRAESSQSQRVSHLVIHRDESGGTDYFAPIAIAAPDTAWATFTALTEQRYCAALADYRLRGYGLHRVNAFQTKAGMRYAAIWQWRRSAPDHVEHDMTLDAFRGAVDRLAQQGYALVHLDGSATRTGARFAGIWEKSQGPAQKVFADLTGAAYRQTAASLTAEGFHPQRIAGYTVGGQARFAAIFAGGAARMQAHHALAAPRFYALAIAALERGHQLRDASGYVVRGAPFYTAIWET
ncbi:MAG: hypothetical protein WDN03_07765 [Rhizomicrobium sp.]